MFYKYMDSLKEDVIDTINNAHVVLREELKTYHQDGNDIIETELRGITLKDPKTGFKGIGLSYTIDNMTKTLIHESLHYFDEQMSEEVVESLTDDLFDDPEVRRVSQKRIVQLCEKYDV